MPQKKIRSLSLSELRKKSPPKIRLSLTRFTNFNHTAVIFVFLFSPLLFPPSVDSFDFGPLDNLALPGSFQPSIVYSPNHTSAQFYNIGKS